jgi:drug/metabolite transporter (DMT)-like permease
MEIIFGVVFGIIIFHEALTLYVLIGGVLILFAAMLPNLTNIMQKLGIKISN